MLIRLFQTGILLDIVVLVLLAVNVISGARQGLVKTLYRGFKGILAAAAAFIFAKPLAALLKETPVYTGLLSRIEARMTEYLSGAAGDSADNALSSMTESMKTLLGVLGRTPEQVQEEYTRLAAQQGADAAQGIVRYLVTPACEAVLTVLCFLLLFFSVSLILWLLMKLLNLLASAPLLNGANKILGFAAGLLLAVFHILIFCMLFDAALPYIEAMQPAITADCVANSHLYRFFDGLNPFALIAAFAV